MHSPLIKPGDVLTPISRLKYAIIKPDGDTLFRAGIIMKQQLHLPMAGLWEFNRSVLIGDGGDDKFTLEIWPRNQLLTVNSSRLNRSAVFNIRSTNGTVIILETINITTANDTRSAELRIPTTCGDSYYPEVTAYTSLDPNNSDQVMHAIRPFYQYSFQQFAGQGTAYGADMKLAYLEGRKIHLFCLATIANRSSSSVIVFSCLFYKGVDKNANPINAEIPR